MRLAVIGDTAHYLDENGRLCALAPVVAQLDRLGGLFDEMLICAPLHHGPPPRSFAPYGLTSLRFVPLTPGGGSGLIAKLVLLPRSIGWWRACRRVARFSGALHFRCPSNVAGVGLVATWRLRRNRYAMYAGNWSGYEGEPLTYRHQRWLLRRPQFAGVVTAYGVPSASPEHVVDFYSPSYDEATWQAEGPAFDHRLERLSEREHLEPVRLVSVGALTANKGHTHVITAVSRLADVGVDARLEIVGGGPDLRRLEDHATAIGVATRVRLLDHCPPGEVRAAFRRADVAVLASTTEGYPKIALEAMVAGAVPVLSGFPTAKALTGDGERGILLPQRSADAIAEAVRTLAQDPRRLASSATRGRTFAHHHTLERFQSDLGGLLTGRWGASLRSGGLGVLQLADRLAVGGRERLMVDLANAFAGKGFRSHTCETRSSGELAAELGDEVNHLVLGRRATWDVSALARFARHVVRHRIDIVHSHGRATMQFVALAVVSFRLPVVHVFHDHLGVHEESAAPLSLRLPVRLGVDEVVAVSADVALWARACLGVPPARVHRVPNGIPVRRFSGARPLDLRHTFNLPESSTALICVANLHEPKDHATLLRAIAASSSNVSLVLVGDEEDKRNGYADRCWRLVSALGIADRIAFAGRRSDVPRLLASAEIGVLSSRLESGPLAVAEYAAAGLPFVATATGDLTQRLGDAAGGLVVPVQDPHALAAAIDELVRLGPDGRREMGLRGKTAVESTLSIDQLADALEGLYGQAIDCRLRAHPIAQSAAHHPVSVPQWEKEEPG